MDVADDHAESNPAVGENLVQPVLLRGQLAHQLLPLPGDQSQLAQLGLRDEGAAQQAGARQGRQPLRIPDVGLATWDVLDVPGIHDQSTNTLCFQRGVRALPVDPRALHHHFVGLKCRSPLRQLAPVPLEASELPLLHACAAIGLLDQRARRDLRLVHVEADHPLVQGHQFHTPSFRIKLRGGR